MKNFNRPTMIGQKAEQALREAVAEVVEGHLRRNLPLAVMRNGKAVFVPPNKLIRKPTRFKYPGADPYPTVSSESKS